MADRKTGAARSRATRRAAFEARFAASQLAIAGAIISTAFLFQRSLPAKCVMLLAFIAATWYSGKRFSPIATLLVSLTIVAANLLLPIGKVLFSLGPLVITDGALLGGMEKAVTFEGLMYASKACILPGLRLPGRFGSIVARAFVYYDRIIEYKGKVKPSTLVDDADALMLEIWEAEAEKNAGGTIPASHPAESASPAKAGGSATGGSATSIYILGALSAIACLAIFI